MEIKITEVKKPFFTGFTVGEKLKINGLKEEKRLR